MQEIRKYDVDVGYRANCKDICLDRSEIDKIEHGNLSFLQIYKDTDYLHGTDRSNKILAILTIFFTLSLPVTIMSSLYGMNVDIPTIEDESLKFLGRYTTFIVIVIGSSAGAVAMALYFHKI